MVKYGPDASLAAERLHDGEPYFLIRGQDLLACVVLAHYAAAARAAGLGDLSQAVAALTVDFAEWQHANRDLVHLPD